MLVDVGDTRLNVEERGAGEVGLLVLHGGPGLDHTMFGSHLDALGDTCRLFLVDERAQGRSDPAPSETWSLEQDARDVEALAAALGLARYAVLGHSFGALIALQHAVDFPGRPAGTIVSSGVASARWFEGLEAALDRFEPVELREQVRSSWEREASAQTQADVAQILSDQLPWHFADPRDPRIEEMRADLAAAVYAPDVLRAAAQGGYGGIEVEDRLGAITHPVLVLAGRHDRTTPAEATEGIAARIPHAQVVLFEDAGHMTYVEEPEAYVDAVRRFLAAL